MNCSLRQAKNLFVVNISPAEISLRISSHIPISFTLFFPSQGLLAEIPKEIAMQHSARGQPERGYPSAAPLGVGGRESQPTHEACRAQRRRARGIERRSPEEARGGSRPHSAQPGAGGRGAGDQRES